MSSEINGKLVGVAKQLSVDLEQQKFDPALCIVTAADRKLLFEDAAAAPLVFLVGPKAIGKTLAMKTLPKTLEVRALVFFLRPGLFVEIRGQPTDSLLRWFPETLPARTEKIGRTISLSTTACWHELNPGAVANPPATSSSKNRQ